MDSLSFSDVAPFVREPDLPSAASINEWGHRVSDARARITSEIRSVDDASPLRGEGKLLLDELVLAFEELQVAEEELHVQTEELTVARTLLESERLRYRALFEHAPVPYIVTDQHGVISDANRAATAFLRVPQPHLQGKPLVVFVSPARRRAFRAQLATFGSSPVEGELHLRIRPRKQATRSVAASVGVVRDRKGAVCELRWLLVDETEERRRERFVRSMNEKLRQRVDERTAELQRALERQEELARAAETARLAAERASREKTELIAIVSHELRTPLAAIGGYAELLALNIRGPLTDPQRTDIGRIQEAQAHILRLVEDLLGYSKLETGRFRFDIGDVIVRDAIDALVSFVRPQAAAKAITVAVRCAADTAVRADDERLRQIVLNLLTNAIKFTPRDGHILIDCSADETEVRIQIQDDGIGIPLEKLQLVFEPYVQLSPSGTSERGWGLGLAISRDLARAMGGDIVAAEAPQSGAVFILKLPRSTRIAPTTRRG
jgi:PAS domain S-box-containing protein